MKLLAKRTILAAAASGILVLGTAACGGTGDASGTASTDGDSGTSTEGNPEEQPHTGTLVCDDLEDAVDEKTGLQPGKSFDDISQDKLDALYAWMAENGAEFKDPELGENVTAVGENGPEYDASDNPPADVFDAYVDGSTAIDEECPDIGFGFE